SNRVMSRRHCPHHSLLRVLLVNINCVAILLVWLWKNIFKIYIYIYIYIKENKELNYSLEFNIFVIVSMLLIEGPQDTKLI
ncbi:MAG: hypothetical protein N7Q72_01355, partial [Spiroplasma sp. Tabriz.8]|nr:hypothetical protein [Spiroplasma sp. Tabriz.8]